jgi:hypothetical protein
MMLTCRREARENPDCEDDDDGMGGSVDKKGNGDVMRGE